MRPIRWVLPALGLVLLAGCTTTATGTPSAQPPRTSASPPTSSRPKTLRLNGIDPCGLIPQSDATKFQFVDAPERKTDEVFKQPECFYDTYFGAGVIMLDTQEGIESWTDGKRNAAVRKADPVLGFPAITVTLPGNSVYQGACDLNIDVAPGQYLQASVQLNDPKSTNEQACVDARPWAEAAMTTLVNEK